MVAAFVTDDSALRGSMYQFRVAASALGAEQGILENDVHGSPAMHTEVLPVSALRAEQVFLCGDHALEIPSGRKLFPRAAFPAIDNLMAAIAEIQIYVLIVFSLLGGL